MDNTLIIGYGNPLRSDDGAGQLFAGIVESWNHPEIIVRAVHQLLPELAEDLSRVKRTVFVDACADTSLRVPRLTEIQPENGEKYTAHTGDPRAMLALSMALYGSFPRAWLLELPAQNFEFGEVMSKVATDGITAGLNILNRLLEGETCTKSA